MGVYKKIMVLAALSCLYGGLSGQVKTERPHYVGGYWGVSLPSSGNFMKGASWTAPAAEYTFQVVPWFAFGGYVGYVSGQEKGITSDRYEGDAVSGYTDRQMSSFRCGIPFYFSYSSGNRRFEPYIRLAGGAVNTDYKIAGDQINRSEVRKWSVFADAGVGCRYFLNKERRWGIDLRCTQKWNQASWELMDIGNDNRFELSLGILLKISR